MSWTLTVAALMPPKSATSSPQSTLAIAEGHSHKRNHVGPFQTGVFHFFAQEWSALDSNA